MSRLTIWSDARSDVTERTTEDPQEIAAWLADLGVMFERWPVRALPNAADQAEVLDAYAAEVSALQHAGGYAAADVVRLPKGTQNTDAMRAKFLDEHTHAEDEVRFFVEGCGAFYLRGRGKVHQVICAAGDLLRVPARTRHWFDMGPAPHFTAIRLFTDPAGWEAAFTGDPIARRFPLFTAAA